jgi:hypothetical protein
VEKRHRYRQATILVVWAIFVSVVLAEFVRDFALAFKAADALRPQAISARSGRTYQPGLGPHGEDAAVSLVLAQLTTVATRNYSWSTQLPYPGESQKCDIALGSPIEWVIEVKMARAFGDNGKPDDTYLKDLLSPYPQDHSALTDATKLRSSRFECQKALLVYGFEYERRPLDPALRALETLLRADGAVLDRVEAAFIDLVHPVHNRGRVLGWEVR